MIWMDGRKVEGWGGERRMGNGGQEVPNLS